MPQCLFLWENKFGVACVDHSVVDVWFTAFMATIRGAYIACPLDFIVLKT